MFRYMLFMILSTSACAHTAVAVRPDVTTIGMRIEGRYVLTQDANAAPQVRVGYSNTSLSWRTHDESIWICAQDVPGPAANQNDHVANEYDVRVDGVTLPPFRPPWQPACVAVVRGLAPGPHRVTLTKRTEAEVGETLFSRPIGLLGAPAVPRTRRLLAVGDSITCGYGILCSGPNAPFDPRTEDGTRSYVALAAHAVAASLETVAYSGRGVWRNRDGSLVDTIPALFRRALPGLPALPRRAAQADVVVINLGTNDVAAGPLDIGAFEQAYRTLLAQTDADSPQALTVLVVGPMIAANKSGAGPNMPATLARVLERLAAQRERQGQPTEVLVFPPQNEPPFAAFGLGCHYHPSRKTHAAMAQTLQDVLRARLRW